MKSLIFTLLLLLSFTQGYKLVRTEIEKDIIKDISYIFDGWIQSWETRGENMKDISDCYLNTRRSAYTIKEIIEIIIEGNLTYKEIMNLIHRLFILIKDIIGEYRMCKNAGKLFIDMINRIKGMTPYKILERVLTRIQEYGRDLLESLSRGINGIKKRIYYDIGYGFSDFIEVILLMNDRPS